MRDAARETLAARLAASRRAVEIPPGARSAAVAAALRRSAPQAKAAAGLGSSVAALEVLLMRRAQRAEDRWSGQISLPGGHVEAFDADLAATAIRETQEEVGLDLARDGHLLGTLTPIQARARGRRVDLWITPVVFEYHGVGDLDLGPEADAAFWLPLGPAGRGEFDADHAYEHEGLVHQLPSWRYGEWVVWGLTHRILGDLTRALAGLRDA